MIVPLVLADVYGTFVNLVSALTGAGIFEARRLHSLQPDPTERDDPRQYTLPLEQERMC